MKRIANYRSGDRAEAFGAVLMQLFCAVAGIPRQEDFGIFDAIATLLRRDGRLMYAEDSFLLQFKSRTERSLEYRGERFKALLNQETALFIARVDLAAADIRLYSTAPVLSHPNVLDNKGIVLYFGAPEKQGEEGVPHASLGEPALHWTAAQLADREFEELAYAVMKHWLELDRWNRRCRKMGIQYQIKWRTNEVPKHAATTMIWNPERAGEALTEVVPAVHLVAGLATSDAALADPVLALMDWMRSRGVEPDPTGTLRCTVAMRAGQEKIANALKRFSDADVAAQVVLVQKHQDRFSFWFQSAGRGKSSYFGQRYEGSIRDLAELGFEIDVAPDSPGRVAVRLSSKWLESRNLELIGASDDVFLLRERRVESSEVG